MSLEQYTSLVAEHGHDMMGIERQFDNWHSYKGPLKVYFVDTSEIGTKIFDDKLRRYLKYPGLRPTVKKERYNYTTKNELPEKFFEVYDKLYKSIKSKGALREPSVRPGPGIRGRLAKAV
jgi:hypothetical protein